jgi:hypothetical protein
MKYRQDRNADTQADPMFFIFSPSHIFIKQLPTHNGTFAFAPTHEATPSAKSKEPFLQTHITMLKSI